MRSELLSAQRLSEEMRIRHYRRKEGAGTEALTMFRMTISPASNQSFALVSSTSCISSSAVLCVAESAMKAPRLSARVPLKSNEGKRYIRD